MTPAKDHPRRCGENYLTYVCNDKTDRITPAGAGKTTSRPCSGAGCQDHPRRCGENGSHHALANSDYGSPPQVRGKPIV